MLNTKQYLLDHGIKPSVQRLAIMEYLIRHRNHPTAEMIFAELSQEIPTLSKMTVYNTLNLFVKEGAALLLNVDEKQTRFDADITNHAHFICQVCKNIYDVMIDTKMQHNNIPEGFVIKETQLIYKGCCEKCSQN